jgi:hypothetical protein
VKDTGIRFLGATWAPIDPEIDKSLHQHYLNKGGKVKVAYDLRYANEVYLIHNHSFYKLQRTGDPVKYENLFELLAWNEKVKQDRISHDPIGRTAKVNTNVEFDKIIEEERKASPSIPVRVTNTQRGRQIQQQLEKVSELKSRQTNSNEKPRRKVKYSPSYSTGRSSSRREISGIKKKLKMKNK